MGTILLVDDNPLRASLRKSILERGGAGVARTSDAAEALCYIEVPSQTQKLSLIITGHTTAGISGPEFVAELRMRMPRVAVLVLSSVGNVESQYEGISGVTHSQANSPDELWPVVNQILQRVEKQSA
ncbi:response regulator [Acidicapsa ligni]|uniref:response regulator n=1 Tax=Acidicapsa ligni TaxID=542300 RepID=UPI0021DF5467|nr:response regulator [Acidicapsa ligni]